MVTMEHPGIAYAAFPELTLLAEAAVRGELTVQQLETRLEEFAVQQQEPYCKMRAWFRRRFMCLCRARHFTPEQVAQVAPDMRRFLALMAR